MLTEFINLLLIMTAKLGYVGIVLLMTVESSFVPFPSEVVVPPAAYLASLGEMNVYLVVISGITGSMIGALINYFLAITLGRTLVYKLLGYRAAKFLLLSEKKLKIAEEYFLKFGNISTFLGRLVPALRQLISIPAGFARMKLKNFLFFTFLGSGLWTIFLAILGYTLGSNKESFYYYYTNLKILIIIVVVIIIIIAIFIKYFYKKKTTIVS